jgi:hypothetical protein
MTSKKQISDEGLCQLHSEISATRLLVAEYWAGFLLYLQNG